MVAKGRAPTYVANTRRLLDLYVMPKWGNRDIRSICRADVADMVDAVVDAGKPIQANRVLAAVRKLLNWSLDRGMIETSPVIRIERPSAEHDRDRVLSADELRLVWRAAGAIGFPYGAIVQMLILTLQRRNEVAHATWQEFGDLAAAVWQLPADRTKNGEPNDIPLSEQGLAVIQGLPRLSKSGLVFSASETLPSGFTHAKKRLDKAIVAVLKREAVGRGDDPEEVRPLPHWTFHDLRRTGATRMAEDLGIAPHVVEAILNHLTGTIRGVAKVYNRATFTRPKKHALDAWGAYVEGLAAGPADSNVRRMRGSK